MAIYSVNQVRHLYVAKNLATEKVTPEDAKATIRPAVDAAKENLYFEFRGATDLMRSDIIPIKNIKYAQATSAECLGRKLMQKVVSLDPDVNGGNPVAGQNYIININIRQYIGMSDRNTTVKYGAARAFNGTTAPKLYAKLAKSLALNFSREVEPLFKFYVVTDSGEEEITASTDIDKLTGNYTGVAIREVEQEWILGVKALEPVYFDVYTTSINVEGDELIWGKVTESSYDTLNNGKEIADLEYFCMGDRGDLYRNIGWPKVMNTQYLVDSDIPYDVIDIHYFYEGGNEQPHKSEKDITIVVPNEDNSSTLTKSILAAIKTASGVDISLLTKDGIAAKVNILDEDC